ncbi:MAG: ankyrin repeat domain-containing protein [Alphaproteobacteria bacterium]|nr:MAG: ankyrin repeat domain-containing protein [Alphaproteobacteria bacterium]
MAASSSPAASSQPTGVGKTPLTLVAEIGDSRALNLLLLYGANPNLPDGTGRTALMLAAERGNCEIVNCLLSSGADPALPDSAGKTALMLAAENGNAEVVRCIVFYSIASSGVDCRKTALMFASERGVALGSTLESNRLLLSDSSTDLQDSLSGKRKRT